METWTEGKSKIYIINSLFLFLQWTMTQVASFLVSVLLGPQKKHVDIFPSFLLQAQYILLLAFQLSQMIAWWNSNAMLLLNHPCDLMILQGF